MLSLTTPPYEASAKVILGLLKNAPATIQEVSIRVEFGEATVKFDKRARLFGWKAAGECVRAIGKVATMYVAVATFSGGEWPYADDGPCHMMRRKRNVSLTASSQDFIEGQINNSEYTGQCL